MTELHKKVQATLSEALDEARKQEAAARVELEAVEERVHAAGSTRRYMEAAFAALTGQVAGEVPTVEPDGSARLLGRW